MALGRARLQNCCGRIYDNSNQPIRIFKKHKAEFYYDDSSEWDKERIINFTGIANAVKKDLNLKK